MVQAMATLGMMYPAKGGLVWGQIRGCYLKSGVTSPKGDLYTYWRVLTKDNDLCQQLASGT